MENTIKKFIEDVCFDLDIPVPTVSYDTSNFPTDTTLAMCDNDTLYIMADHKHKLDLFFSIAHELRHLWQIADHEAYWLDGYKTSDMLSVEDYNLQPAELDANAYAYIIMFDIFGVKALFEGLSQNVIDKILLRVREIEQEYFE